MLYYGNESDEVINIGIINNMMIYSLASFREGFIKLNTLVPPNEIGRFSDRDFDIVYANYILNNEYTFTEFFQIIYNLYINEMDFAENIIESMMKFIQQRYGYNGIKIDSDDDFIYAQNNYIGSFAPGFGIYNLDIDKERFSYLIESYRLSNNGNLPFNLEGFVVYD